MITCAIVVALVALLGVVIGLRLFRDINRFVVISSVGALVSLVPASSLGSIQGASANISLNLGFFRFEDPDLVYNLGGIEHSWMIYASLVFIAAAGLAASAYIKVNGPRG